MTDFVFALKFLTGFEILFRLIVLLEWYIRNLESCRYFLSRPLNPASQHHGPYHGQLILN